MPDKITKNINEIVTTAEWIIKMINESWYELFVKESISFDALLEDSEKFLSEIKKLSDKIDNALTQ